MKKIMIVAAAALWGTVAFSVESGNMVGYIENDTPDSGNKLIAATFVTVGENGTFTLADLRGTGYDPDEGAWGEMKVTVLNAAGAEARDASDNKLSFFWYDNEDNGTGWFDGNGEVAWDEATSFPAGQGFWVQGNGQTLVFTAE